MANIIPYCQKDVSVADLQGQACVFSGWLRKRGKRNAFPGAKKFFSWSRRFIVLCDGCMYSFSNERSKAVNGAFSLYGYNSVYRAPDVPESEALWAFKIVHTQQEYKTYFLSAMSEPDMKEWMKQVKLQMMRANNMELVVGNATGFDTPVRSKPKHSINTFEEIEEDIYGDRNSEAVKGLKLASKTTKLQSEDSEGDDDDDDGDEFYQDAEQGRSHFKLPTSQPIDPRARDRTPAPPARQVEDEQEIYIYDEQPAPAVPKMPYVPPRGPPLPKTTQLKSPPTHKPQPPSPKSPPQPKTPTTPNRPALTDDDQEFYCDVETEAPPPKPKVNYSKAAPMTPKSHTKPQQKPPPDAEDDEYYLDMESGETPPTPTFTYNKQQSPIPITTNQHNRPPPQLPPQTEDDQEFYCDVDPTQVRPNFDFNKPASPMTKTYPNKSAASPITKTYPNKTKPAQLPPQNDDDQEFYCEVDAETPKAATLNTTFSYANAKKNTTPNPPTTPKTTTAPPRKYTPPSIPADDEQELYIYGEEEPPPKSTSKLPPINFTASKPTMPKGPQARPPPNKTSSLPRDARPTPSPRSPRSPPPPQFDDQELYIYNEDEPPPRAPLPTQKVASLPRTAAPPPAAYRPDDEQELYVDGEDEAPPRPRQEWIGQPQVNNVNRKTSQTEVVTKRHVPPKPKTSTSNADDRSSSDSGDGLGPLSPNCPTEHAPPVPTNQKAPPRNSTDRSSQLEDKETLVRNAMYTGESENARAVINDISQEGAYLIRQGTSGWVLVVYASEKTRNYKIMCKDKQFCLSDNRQFESIGDLIQHYTLHRLPVGVRLSKSYAQF